MTVATGARETRRQGRGSVWERTEYPYLRYRHPAHAHNIVVSVRSNHPELTQVCRVLSTFSPSSGGSRCVGYLYTVSEWFNPLEPPRTFSNHFSADKARCEVFDERFGVLSNHSELTSFFLFNNSLRPACRPVPPRTSSNLRSDTH